ncbi:8169_t:CDS:2 [Entrophospora sp. SA101]|nr:8169_t:CDS:2 [Entrophospora sp. SA101]
MTFITFKDDAKNIVEKKPKHKKKSNIVINKKVIDQVKSRYTKTADGNHNVTLNYNLWLQSLGVSEEGKNLNDYMTSCIFRT